MSREIALLEEICTYLRPHADIEQVYQLSSSQPYIIDRKDRKHLYLYTTTQLILSIEDFGTITTPTVGWIDLALQQGIRIYATNQTNPVPVLIRATDNEIETSTDIQVVSASGNFNNASVGTLESAIPASATLIGANDSAGNLDELLVESDANPNLRVGLFNAANEAAISAVGNLSITPYPANATPITAASGNVANATATATLAAAANKTTYITGFAVTGSGATVGLPVLVTVTNVITGTLTYVYAAAAGVLVENTDLIITFPSPIPANAQNTTIVVSCPALGAGNTNNTVNAYGFQL